MGYMKVAEAAEKWNLSSRQVQKLCQTGQIPNVLRDVRNSYMIPEDASLPPNSYARKNLEKGMKRGTKLPLPIGVSNFKKAVSEYYYIDKTLMIKDLLDIRPQAALFTRPRRFGKTLNMDMLRTFFEHSDEDTSIYFKDKKIWKCGKTYRDYQGKYPVIFMTFKDAKFLNWKDMFAQLKSIIQVEYSRHKELKAHPVLSEYEREYYDKIMDGSASDVDWSNALSMLSAMLDEIYGIAPIVIIDEYDTPIQEGHVKGFYDQVISFMRNFFSAGLKDNPHLSFAFMAGILRVAKESIFSGMNNLKIYSVLDHSFSEYFGFEETEISEIAAYYQVPEKKTELKAWYNGYRFGSREIYNPWSVMNYFSDQCVPKAFWQSTGSNEIIGEIIEDATTDILENFENLMQGEKVLTYIDTGVIYPEVQKNPSSAFSFLLVTGYLKCEAVDFLEDGSFMCHVKIPNKEISLVYEKEILEKFANASMPSLSVSVKHALYREDVEALQKSLNQFMLQSVSYYDTSAEGFYHGMMLGFCAMLSRRYYLISNRESGDGRFDIQMKPRSRQLPGILMEFKVEKKGSGSQAALERLAGEALGQIEGKRYGAELEAYGCEKILKFGIAFYKKSAVIRQDIWEKKAPQN